MALPMEQLERWINRKAIDKDGHRIGTIADVYIDDAIGDPEWLAVMTGLFGSRISFVPLAGATERGDEIQVAYAKSLVKDSPNVDADGELSDAEEEQLYRHYGMTYRGPAPTEEADADVEAGGGGAGVAKMQDSGSASFTEASPQIARTRLRRRDAASVKDIDLSTDDLDS